MKPRVYKYRFKSLLLTGMIFLTVFPLITGGLIWFFNLSYPIVVYSLAAIYLCDLAVLGALFVTAWNKSVVISDNTISFKSQLLSQDYGTMEISEITLLATQQGREFLRIGARKKTYLLDEQYQSWGSLVADLEKFAKNNGISSNLAD